VTLTSPLWTGGSVRETLDIQVQTDAGRSIATVDALVGIALRHNPKRAHLLVSTVLAKHVPTVPGLALAAGELLGLLASAAVTDAAVTDAAGTEAAGRAGADAARQRAREFGGTLAGLISRLAEPTAPTDPTAPSTAGSLVEARRELADLRRDIRAATTAHPGVVTLGYAETATGLGQLVADSLAAYYLHSTRHAPAGATPFAGFAEEHSHATDHALLPTDPGWLRADGTTVLVDDELSTGTTVINTITALHALRPQRHWVVASLIDLRSAADLARFDELAARLGIRIDVVCLAAGSIGLPDDVLDRAGRMIHALPAAPADSTVDGTVQLLDCADLTPVHSARFGTTRPVDPGAAAVIARRITDLLPIGTTGPDPADRGILVLGSEEFIALPMLLADALDSLVGARTVRFSTSTRSPIATLDRPDYPIRSAITFRSHDTTSDGIGVRFAYNLTAASRHFGTVVFLPEPGTDPAALHGPDGVIEAIRRVSDTVVVVLLPASILPERTPTP
jgi:hypothetical protein